MNSQHGVKATKLILTGLPYLFYLIFFQTDDSHISSGKEGSHSFLKLIHITPKIKIPFFALSDNLKNQNFKIKKKTPGDIITLHMTIMQQSYDVCFLRYGAQQAEFFVILDHFCPVFSFFQNFDFQGTYKF